METRNFLGNISCISHRYSLSESTAFGNLSKYIPSEAAGIESYAKDKNKIVGQMPPHKVYKETTKNYIRAVSFGLKNVTQNVVLLELKESFENPFRYGCLVGKKSKRIAQKYSGRMR